MAKKTKDKVPFEKQVIRDTVEHRLNSGVYIALAQENQGGVEYLNISQGRASFISAAEDEVPDLIKVIRRMLEIYDAYETLRPTD